MKTKDVNIEWNSKPAIVKLKRISFGDMNEINQEATQIKAVGNVPQVMVNHKILKEKSLLKGIVEAPFPIDIQNIQNLENDIGNQLWEEFAELNQQSPRAK